MIKFVIAFGMIVTLAGCEAGPTYVYEFPHTAPVHEGRTYQLRLKTGEIIFVGTVQEVGETGVFFTDGADLCEVQVPDSTDSSQIQVPERE